MNKRDLDDEADREYRRSYEALPETQEEKDLGRALAEMALVALAEDPWVDEQPAPS